MTEIYTTNGWTAEIRGDGHEHDDWFNFRLGPIRIYVWVDHKKFLADKHIAERKVEWEMVMHYGDLTMKKGGFTNKEDAQGYGINMAIDLTRGFVTTLEACNE